MKRNHQSRRLLSKKCHIHFLKTILVFAALHFSNVAIAQGLFSTAVPINSGYAFDFIDLLSNSKSSIPGGGADAGGRSGGSDTGGRQGDFNTTLIPGGSDTGGGMGLGGSLVDFAEALNGKARVPFNPQELDLLKKPLEKYLSSLSKNLELRDFVLDLLFNSKRIWYFTNEPLEKYLKNPNVKILLDKKNKKNVVAVQSQEWVLIKLSWIQSVNELQQVGLMVHEALMSVALDYKLSHDAVREVNRAIFAKHLGGGVPQNLNLLLSQQGYIKPLRDYLERIGQKSLIYTISSVDELKEKIDREESGYFEFVRIEIAPFGQTKIVFRRRALQSIRPHEVIVEQSSATLKTEKPDATLIWSGVINQESDNIIPDLITYIYRIK